MLSRRALLSGITLAVAGSALAASRQGQAGPVTIDEIGDQVQTLSRGQLPDFARTPDVRVAYRYAVDRGEELQYVPCFCGCVRFGHASNRDCYVKSMNVDGTMTFTSHAAT